MKSKEKEYTSWKILYNQIDLSIMLNIYNYLFIINLFISNPNLKLVKNCKQLLSINSKFYLKSINLIVNIKSVLEKINL